MSITYSAQNGSQITSYAMNETLGNQSQQTGNNTVVVSDTLANAGNGQIGSKWGYPGRLCVVNLGGTEQVRMITADAAGTGNTRILTVHADWDTNPVATSDTIHVVYDVDDIETGGAGGGISLSSKTGLYELSNTLTVNSGGGLQNSWSQGLEADDRGSNIAIIITGDFYSGYDNTGVPVAGGIFTSYNNTAAEPNWQWQSGSRGRIYNAFFWSQLVAQQFECANGSDVQFVGTRSLNNSRELHLYDATVRDSEFKGKQNSAEIIRLDAGSDIDGAVFDAVNNLDSAADTTTETIEIRDVLINGLVGQIAVRQNKTWNVINPTWSVTVYSDLTWPGTATGNELNDRRSVDAVVQTAAGTKLQDALVNVFEGTQLDDLVLKLTTDANGVAGDSFIYRKHATNSVTTTYGAHALQCGKWLYGPLVFTQVSSEKFDGVITLALDPNIVQTTQATAITDGSGIVWNEDTNPSELFAFTGGSGTLAAGMVLTFSPSGAVGTITESLEGDSVAGKLHLKTRNGTAIANGDTFTRTGGTAGSFSGTYTNDSKQPFAVWIEANAKSYQTQYDYWLARMTETTLSAAGEIVWEWCRDQQNQPLFVSGAGFKTERSNGKGIIVINAGAGTVEKFTDDAGNTYVPPATATLKTTYKNKNGDLMQGIRVRYQESDGTLIAIGESNASGVFEASVPVADLPFTDAVIRARRKDFEDVDQTLDVPTTGFDIPIELVPDTTVNLPL